MICFDVCLCVYTLWGVNQVYYIYIIYVITNNYM